MLINFHMMIPNTFVYNGFYNNSSIDKSEISKNKRLRLIKRERA